MEYIDVFNGDADGICALHQLRLASPVEQSRLITGVKRDIRLLRQLSGVRGARITVLDISLDRNRPELEQLLAADNQLVYIDHHYSGDIPDSPALEVRIDPSEQTCTSLLVDTLLGGQHTTWALAGAFGDNLDEVAAERGRKIGLNSDQLECLREIGQLLNYNGYGFSTEDLLIHPAELFREVQPYEDPLDFYHQSRTLEMLQQGYDNDMGQARELTPLRETEGSRIFQLPNQPWSRRVVGVFSNLIAREQPTKAHAVVIVNHDQSLRISVRAPMNKRKGADQLCRQFPSGGGRAAAAGINSLPAELVEQFYRQFSDHFSR
ncbi:DHH family phosphoesterase [Desulfogranum mediterraneum]|uniref:DHH family phosphoesterase n=1 Tax=Desulfogranum mediterraneum TaxID=160661 RepID=UPI00040C75B3|nr:DHH family phosphoesterase [Desulfogranum mediterraneum]